MLLTVFRTRLEKEKSGFGGRMRLYQITKNAQNRYTIELIELVDERAKHPAFLGCL